jgi:hypothetical protein
VKLACSRATGDSCGARFEREPQDPTRAAPSPNSAPPSPQPAHRRPPPAEGGPPPGFHPAVHPRRWSSSSALGAERLEAENSPRTWRSRRSLNQSIHRQSVSSWAPQQVATLPPREGCTTPQKSARGDPKPQFIADWLAEARHTTIPADILPVLHGASLPAPFRDTQEPRRPVQRY